MKAKQTLIPFQGIDEIRFGMTQNELARVAGDADGVEVDDILEVTTERRGSTEYEFENASGTLETIYSFKPGRGQAIRQRLEGAPYVPLFYDGLEILDPSGFATLVERERTVEGIGNVGVLFPDLGFLVVGFRKRVDEGKYVLSFSRDMLSFYEEDWLNV